MTRYTLVSIIAAAAFALVGAAPSMAAQPYPLNYQTFALGSPDSTMTSGVVYSNSSVTLASSGLGSIFYTDPFSNYSNDGVTATGNYVSGTWTSPVVHPNFGF